jgi:hypothetical protein
MSLFEYFLGIFIVGIVSLFVTLIFGLVFSDWLLVFLLYGLFYSLGVLDEKKANRRL